MRRPHVLRLTGSAARYLQVLQDFGHLDDEQVARVVMAITPRGRGPQLAEVSDVRRAAAVHLFDRTSGELDGLLAEDWPLLFS